MIKSFYAVFTRSVAMAGIGIRTSLLRGQWPYHEITYGHIGANSRRTFKIKLKKLKEFTTYLHSKMIGMLTCVRLTYVI